MQTEKNQAIDEEIQINELELKNVNDLFIERETQTDDLVLFYFLN